MKGLQVAPSELEGYLLGHPDVADAAVIGVPDDYAGELPRAYVVPSQPNVDPQEISDFVASRLTDYKHLTGGVFLVDSIPKNLSGKILRRQIREWAERGGSVVESGSLLAKL